MNCDATAATVKNTCRKLCLMYCPDKNISPRNSKVTEILKQVKRYIDDSFNFIEIQVIEIHDYNSDSDREKNMKLLSV